MRIGAPQLADGLLILTPVRVCVIEGIDQIKGEGHMYLSTLGLEFPHVSASGNACF